MSFDINDMQAGSSVEPLEEGALPAVIVGLVSYGVQAQTDWQTGAPKPSEKRLGITFEFPTEVVEKEQDDGTVIKLPRRLTKEYKVSSHKKAGIMVLIRKIASGIENLKDLLGKKCTVTVGRTSTGKAKVEDVSPLMKGIAVDDPLNGVHSFDFYNPTEEDFKAISRWQQKVVTEAEDYDGFADSWLPEEEEGDY
jgi:hypothetical protein